MTRPLLLASLSLLAVAATAAVVATVRPDRKPNAKPSRKAVDPVDTLVTQLHRRFSDRQNVEFGFERMRRPLVRGHAGPIADKNDVVYYSDEGAEGSPKFDPKRVRLNAEGEPQIRTEAGTWIDYDRTARDQMFPENVAERTAIETLRADGREIALYTFGLYDNTGSAARLRGPAYLRQLGPKAPDAETLEAVARTAWKGATPTLPGWKLRIESVFAQKSCVACHNSEEVSWGRTERQVKAGDRLGLFLIAEKTSP